MTAKSKLRGRDIVHDEQADRWRYRDGSPTDEAQEDRPCRHCGRSLTPEGHDGCLGTLPGVMNACCGHGVIDEAYVQLLDRRCLAGQAARDFLLQHASPTTPER